MVKLTPNRQRNAVSEGIALGFVLNGYGSIKSEKYLVDLAVESGWKNWRYASRFSQVTTDLRNGLDGVYALSRAEKSKRTLVFFWELNPTDGGLEVHFRQANWDPDVQTDIDFAVSVIDGDVPADGWRELAWKIISELIDEK